MRRLPALRAGVFLRFQCLLLAASALVHGAWWYLFDELSGFTEWAERTRRLEEPWGPAEASFWLECVLLLVALGAAFRARRLRRSSAPERRLVVPHYRAAPVAEAPARARRGRSRWLAAGLACDAAALLWLLLSRLFGGFHSPKPRLGEAECFSGLVFALAVLLLLASRPDAPAQASDPLRTRGAMY